MVNHPVWGIMICSGVRPAARLAWRRWSSAYSISSLAVAAAGRRPRGTVIFAGGAWAAIDRGAVCEALSRSQKVAPKDKVQADRRDQLHRRPPPLGRVPRAAEPHAARRCERDAQIGDQPFLLVAAVAGRGAAARRRRRRSSTRCATRPHDHRSRDAAGVRFTDPYLLDGAPTAIDAAAARCALRGAGKIQ